MKPFLIHLARKNDADTWRIGFDCGKIVFWEEFHILNGPEPSHTAANAAAFAKMVGTAMRKAIAGMETFYSLPVEEQEQYLQRLSRMHASVGEE